ncbi:hypothetical protein FRC07_003557 [Ceratobasidium sp. 392]|nr:hypothetical protein FRC07_003557 [Ceratobasidium sp. 392]
MPVNGAETSVDEEEGDEDEYMVRTTDQVGFGAGRARVQSGVGIGGGRAKGGKMSRREGSVKSKVDSGLARSGSAATARPRVDSARARTESFTRQRVDTITRARVDSTARPRVDSAVRARVDSGLRRKSGANDSPVSSADATSVSRSPSTTSTRRAMRTPVGRKASATSMRKSSTSSLRSTTTTTTRTVPTTASTKKTSVSSVSGSEREWSGDAKASYASPEHEHAPDEHVVWPKRGVPSTERDDPEGNHHVSEIVSQNTRRAASEQGPAR